MSSALSPHAEQILRLVSGLPKAVRERRQILVLQAFIDDSRSTGEFMVLSGFISSVAEWLKFADEWQELLDGLHRESFKMSHLAAGGGDITTEQASWFYRVAERHARHSVTIAVNERMLSKLVDEFQLPDLHKQPYYIALPGIMRSLTNLETSIGFAEPIEVIFDKQSIMERPFLRMWDEFYETLGPREKEMFSIRPHFEDDKKFLPLQAADLQAYWMREHFLAGGNSSTLVNPYPWKMRYDSQCIVIEHTESQLRQLLSDYRAEYVKHARENGYADAATYPDEVFDFRGSRPEWRK